MIQAIIIDDEQHCIDSLRADLSGHCPSVTVVDVCHSGKEGILAVHKHKPQLVFLDVEMPWMNGFEMLELLEHIDFSIIFTTAYDRFAARAFRISAVDYLLKPVDVRDLAAAVNKVESRIKTADGVGNIQNLLNNIALPVAQQKVAFPFRDGYEFIPLESILYCEAEGSYTSIHLINNKHMLVSRTLGDVEEMLPAEFFIRIHNSTLVNIGAVTHYVRTDGGFVMLKDGGRLAVSKGRKDSVLQRLGLR